MAINPPPYGTEVSLVHKVCELYKLFHKCLLTFPKQEKFTIGQKTENTILEILELALSAVYLPKYDKSKMIRKASDKTDLLKYLARFTYETKSINLKSYILLEEKILEIGKMLGGWIKSAL